MSNTFRCVAAALLAATPSLLNAQQQPVSSPPPSAEALTALVDSVVNASLLSQGVPSVSVAVVHGDETLVQRAWGRADVASGRAADPSTVYALGSTSKQFTAALVLRLVDRGRLTLADSISQHLSGLRPEWTGITIEQLLNHTSGLPRSSSVDMSRMDENVPGDSIVARAAREPMAAQPGTGFIYSNTGYAILRVLIERLYEKPYAAVLRDEIAGPLGLPTLRYCGDVPAVSRATGYRLAWFDGTLLPPPPLHPSQMLGASGICSSAGDLAKWNRALHGGQVLSDASYTAMTTPRGAARGYGFGLSLPTTPWGDPAIIHGGEEVSGFVSQNGWYPADSLSVTILYNVHPVVSDGSTHVIAALALGRTPPAMRLSTPVAGTATPAVYVVGEEARRQFVGEYAMGPDAVFTVAFEDGAFVVTMPGGAEIPLVHEQGATYAIGGDGSDTAITFLADASGRVVGFEVQEGESSERRLRKL